MPERLHRPEPIEVYLQPRPGGGVRRMARLSPRDSRAWEALAGRVGGTLEGRLSSGVIANRRVRRAVGWATESARESRRRLSRATGLLRRAPVLLTTDVRDFYPSVSPEVLARALRSAGAAVPDSRWAADLLDAWGSLGYAGLPIGPPGSGMLANALLLAADAALRAPFVRWVDDYVIGAKSEREAAEILERLDLALGDLGLARSAVKTRIGDRPAGWLAFTIRNRGPSPGPASRTIAATGGEPSRSSRRGPGKEPSHEDPLPSLPRPHPRPDGGG